MKKHKNTPLGFTESIDSKKIKEKINDVVHGSEQGKILILGYGATGKALVAFCKNKKYDFFVFGDNLPDDSPANFFSEMDALDLTKISICVISPGFKESHFMVRRLKSHGVPIVSEIDFASCFTNARIIGVTGTNGKTTSVSMIKSVLGLKYQVHLVGNIGIPFIGRVDYIEDDDLVVLEVSSAQLEFTYNISFFVAVILNIKEDHSDRYKSFYEYVGYKKRILQNSRFQILGLDMISSETYNDFRFTCLDVSVDEIFEVYHRDNFFTFVKNKNKEEFKFLPAELQSQSLLTSGSLAFAIGIIFGLDTKSVLDKIKLFKPLEHRIEFFHALKGVSFFNDSKATNPDATRFAISNFLNKSLVLITGGHDYKDMSYHDLAVYIRESKLKHVVVLGNESKNLINSLIAQDVVFTLVCGINEAIEFSWEISSFGDIVLFSPGCNGRDMFINHKQRGRLFKKRVKKIIYEK